MLKKEPVIYLDNNATTPIDPSVLEEMLPYLTEFYGNPSSPYRFGLKIAKAIETAREQVAHLLGCRPNEMIFTSGGTESNNSSLASALTMDPSRRHLITTRIEHSAILKQSEWLAKRGYEITLLNVNEKGQIDLEELEQAIRPDTAMVSVMWANNETGGILPIHEIAAIVHQKKLFFHTDAIQAVGKIPIHLANEYPQLNFLSVSAHKIHGPKGVGALYVNHRSKFNPYLIGGSQENGKRAGTQNVAGIVGFGKACELAGQLMRDENREVRALRDLLETAILEKISGTQINGDTVNRLPNTTNLAFKGVEAEAILMLLDKHQICCSAGAACTTGSPHPSHVFKAMGLSTDRARSSLRFSLSRFNTRVEIEKTIHVLPEIISKLQ